MGFWNKCPVRDKGRKIVGAFKNMNKLLTPIFHGKINKNRKVELEDKRAYLVWLCHFKVGSEIELTVKKKTKKRSNAQNHYYWSICQIIEQESGYESTDEVHEALKLRYLRKDRPGLPPTIGSTTDMTTAEFSDMIEKIKREAAQGVFGGDPEKGYIYIPDAGYFE